MASSNLPLASYQITGPILDPKTAFEIPGQEVSEHTAKLYLNVTDDVADQVKGQISEYPPSLTSPGNVAETDL